ncbi:alpha/beta hydrolase [Streptacidiphilus sp. PB12-B1b]|uniref:alpha/beta fold hydrolase n=1 Tax=Streptacidiphilus sp. PB12-B1b TaxID=2705012 RepID=UPI0015FA9096|nr:alpha/beta hydrolase [Streptacidiphilus sp. PB12-B1b]QMU76669.1 alpha/beta hydrolase [Streptacidiphilus sp. PB12-B1b]
MTTVSAPYEEALTRTFHGHTYRARVIRRRDARTAPIVLIGGAFQNQYAWGRVERGLLGTADLITVDLPGAGDADPLPAGYGLDFLTAALDDLLTSVLGDAPVNVVGASYGSAVAHRWVRENQERTVRLVLIGTMSRLPEEVRARMRHSLHQLRYGSRGDFVDSVLNAMMCLAPGVAIMRRAAVVRCLTAALDQLSDAGAAQYVQNTRRLLDHREQAAAAEVRVPVLVATGEHDPLTTPGLNREAAEGCADAHFTTIRDADHLVHLERPAEVVDLVARFLTGQSLDGLDYCHPVERLGSPSGLLDRQGR